MSNILDSERNEGPIKLNSNILNIKSKNKKFKMF